MNTRIWQFVGLMLGLVMFSSPSMAQPRGQKPDPCKDAANSTQKEMDECAIQQLRAAEFKLQRLLKQLGIRTDSPEQKAWEAYRDAQLDALYPQKDISSYGSVYPMCFANLKKALTEGRIRDLKELTTTEEGDVCNGYRAAGPKDD